MNWGSALFDMLRSKISPRRDAKTVAGADIMTTHAETVKTYHSTTEGILSVFRTPATGGFALLFKVRRKRINVAAG